MPDELTPPDPRIETPKKAKHLSGSDQQKRKAELAGVTLGGKMLPNLDDDGKWAEAFVEAGLPDLENAGTDLDYVRKLQLICLRQMACTAFPTLGQQNLWRRIKDMSATVGMTSNRAQLESKVKKLTKALEKHQQPSTIQEVKGSSIVWPSNARGGMTGPRSVSDPITPDGD